MNYQSKHIICNNCNKPGHVYSNCKAPITSYGIILYKIDNDIPKILMINRKDSLCYIDFIRGKYNINNTDYIQLLIDKCSNKEKHNIISKDYEILWKDLWLIENLSQSKFIKDYEVSKIKFEKIRDGVYSEQFKKKVNLISLVNYSKTNYQCPEWEFPKGRKNNNEKNIDCATRECHEETNFESNDYNIIINLGTFQELYTGENRIRYCHIYYLSELINYQKEIEVNKTELQKMEVGDMKWLNQDECLHRLREYHSSRVKIIERVFSLLNNLEDYIIM